MMYRSGCVQLLQELDEEYIDLRDSLEDTISSFEDLHSELEAALSDICDSLESVRDGLNTVVRTFRKIQRRQKAMDAEYYMLTHPSEPGEPFTGVPPLEVLFPEEVPFPEDQTYERSQSRRIPRFTPDH